MIGFSAYYLHRITPDPCNESGFKVEYSYTKSEYFHKNYTTSKIVYELAYTALPNDSIWELSQVIGRLIALRLFISTCHIILLIWCADAF